MPAFASGPTKRGFVILFNILAFSGFFLILVVLLPALLSPRIKRSKAWFGVMFSWLLYSISHLLIVGRQAGPEPSFGLCMFQGCLIYATIPLCAASTICFAFDFFVKLSTATSGGLETVHKRARMVIYAPWILGFVIFGGVILSVDDPSDVRRIENNIYCHVDKQLPYLINICIVCLCGLILTSLEIYMAIMLRKNWALFKRLSKNHSGIALSTLVRLALFTTLSGISLIFSILGAIHPNLPTLLTVCRMILVAFPILAALCFGGQRDIIKSWLFWTTTRPPKNYLQEP